MLIVIVLAVYSALAVYEFVPLFKESKWVDFWVNMALFAISLTMAVLITLDINIPSPETPIREFITFVFGEF